MGIEKLANILEAHRKYLIGDDDGEIANLSGANLRSSDLIGADLSGADLRGANLRVADLSGAYLKHANLSGANLRHANLSGANLSGANLSGANLSGANLRSSDLIGAYLRGADLRGADLRGADLRVADLRDAIGLIYVAQRSDGHQFFAVHDGGEWMIRAGCRYMTIASYREHAKEYNNIKRASETNIILDFAEAMIKDRGII